MPLRIHETPYSLHGVADVAIIGSGMGGMTAARLLSQRGLNVHIFEQHTVPGGMTLEFAGSGGATFSSGLHYLGLDPTRRWLPLFERVTDGKIGWAPMPIEYDHIHLPNLDFAIPAGEDAFRHRLIERFPHEETAIRLYFQDMVRAGNTIARPAVFGAFSATLALFASRLGDWLSPIATMRTIDYMQGRFDDPDLIALLTGQWGDMALPSHSAFGYHAQLVGHYLHGAMYPLGGSRSIAAAALSGLRREGGTVHVGCKVEEILVDRGRVTGLRYRHIGENKVEMIRAHWVISDAGVRNTFERLLPPDLRAGYAPALGQLADNCSAVCAFIALSRSPADLGATGANIWISDTNDPDVAMGSAPGDGQVFASFPSLKDRRRKNHTIEIVSPCDAGSFARWQAEAHPRRDEDYLALKRSIGVRLVERLESVLPRLSDIVDSIEVATPLTFETYQNSPSGAFYGLDPTPAKSRARLARVRTPVRGLFLAGQDVLMPGIVPAMIGGALAACAALGPRQGGALLKQVLRQ